MSTTSTTSAVSLGLGGLAGQSGQSGQAQQAQKPSRSETPPVSGCPLLRLPVRLFGEIGSHLLPSEIGKARCASKQLADGLATSPAGKVYLSVLGLTQKKYQISEVGNRPSNSPCQLKDRSWYDSHTGMAGAIWRAEDSDEWVLHAYPIGTRTDTTVQELSYRHSEDSQGAFHLGGGLVAVEQNIVGSGSDDESCEVGIWDMKRGKITHLLKHSGRLVLCASIDPNYSLLMLRFRLLSSKLGEIFSLFDLAAIEGALKPLRSLPLGGILLNDFVFDFSHKILCVHTSPSQLVGYEYESGKQLWRDDCYGYLGRSIFSRGKLYQWRPESIIQIDVATGEKLKNFPIKVSVEVGKWALVLHVDEASRRIFASIRLFLKGTAQQHRIMAWDIDTGTQLTSFSCHTTTQSGTARQLDYIAEAGFILLSCSGDLGVRIYSFEGTLLHQINSRFPSGHPKGYSTEVENTITTFNVDKKRQKLLVHDKIQVKDAHKDFWDSTIRVVDFSSESLTPSTSSQQGAEPAAKRARLASPERKDSNDEKKS